MIWCLWFIPCAIANRIRGGWLGDSIRKVFPWWGTTTARLFVASVISLPVAWTCPWGASLSLLSLVFGGFLFTWSPWTDMKKPARDVILLTLRGLVLTAPGGYVAHLYIFGFTGALMGIAYYIAYKVPWDFEEENGYVWNGSDWGELIFGGILGLGVFLSLAMGW